MADCDCVNPKAYGHSSNCPLDQIEELKGYQDAFYKLAEMLGLTAMPISPKEAFEIVMMPRLRELIDGLPDARVNIMTRSSAQIPNSAPRNTESGEANG